MKLLRITVVAILVCTSGCSLIEPGEFYIGKRRIDEVQQTQVMRDKPLKCLFIDCDKGGDK